MHGTITTFCKIKGLTHDQMWVFQKEYFTCKTFRVCFFLHLNTFECLYIKQSKEYTQICQVELAVEYASHP